MKKLDFKQMESLAGGLTQGEIISIACAAGGIVSLLLLFTPLAPLGVASGTAFTIGCSFLAIAIVAQDAYYRANPGESNGISAGTGDPALTTHHSQNGDESAGTTDGAGTMKMAHARFN